VKAARSLLFRLPSLWFFQLRCSCTEFRAPLFRIRKKKLPHPFRIMYRLLGAGQGSGSLLIDVVRTVCSREQAQTRNSSDPASVVPYIYSQPGQKLEHPCFYWIDRHLRERRGLFSGSLVRMVGSHRRASLPALKTAPIQPPGTPVSHIGNPGRNPPENVCRSLVGIFTSNQ